MSEPTTEELIKKGQELVVAEVQLGDEYLSDEGFLISQLCNRLQSQADEIRVKDICIKSYRKLEKTWQEDDRLKIATDALKYYEDEALWGTWRGRGHKDTWQIPEDGFALAQKALKQIEGK